MKSPAIFIDAYITTNDQKKWFDYNLSNFIKNDWDIFIISNKMTSFDKFSEVKYFEYDCNNRILTDTTRYKISSPLSWFYELYNKEGEYRVEGLSGIHGFTNWTILYNLKRICKVLKKFGYKHAIRCEYDVSFKDYKLMNTIFSSFNNDKKCMILPGDWGCTTNFFLFDVEYLDSKIPELETESDYLNFMHTLYNTNESPVFESLFKDIVHSECEYLNVEKTFDYIDKISACASSDDSIYRHKNVYKKLFLSPINNNSEFFFYNSSLNKKNIYINYSTFDSFDNLITSNIVLHPDQWILKSCNKYVEVNTSDMMSDESLKFDLVNEPCKFTMIKH